MSFWQLQEDEDQYLLHIIVMTMYFDVIIFTSKSFYWTLMYFSWCCFLILELDSNWKPETVHFTNCKDVHWKKSSLRTTKAGCQLCLQNETWQAGWSSGQGSEGSEGLRAKANFKTKPSWLKTIFAFEFLSSTQNHRGWRKKKWIESGL